jgi:hypothetical protein
VRLTNLQACRQCDALRAKISYPRVRIFLELLRPVNPYWQLQQAAGEQVYGRDALATTCRAYRAIAVGTGFGGPESHCRPLALPRLAVRHYDVAANIGLSRERIDWRFRVFNSSKRKFDRGGSSSPPCFSFSLLKRDSDCEPDAGVRTVI